MKVFKQNIYIRDKKKIKKVYKYQFQVEKAKNIMWDKWKEVGKKIVKVSYFPIPSFVKIHLCDENWFIGKYEEKNSQVSTATFEYMYMIWMNLGGLIKLWLHVLCC